MKGKLQFNFYEYFLWVIKRILQILKRNKNSNKRYQLRSPSFKQNQILFDKTKNEEIVLKINDEINLKVLFEIFIYESYDLKRLSRHKEIINYYHELINQTKIPLILDIGANCGFASVYFSNEFSKAQIIAIEPDTTNFQLALENTKKLDNIKMIQAGIASTDGRGLINNTNGENWAFQTSMSDKGELEMISVSTIMNKYNLEKHVPLIAKIDIEGFEENLFEKNTEIFSSFYLVIIELHDWLLPRTANSSNFLKWHLSTKRDFVIYGENVFSIKNG